MRTVKPLRPSVAEPEGPPPEGEEDDVALADREPDAEFTRVPCPECAQPVGVVAPGAPLPEHALVATPWKPFGLTVCPGSGRAAPADPAAAAGDAPSAAPAVLAALPEGLHWRLQPFSHASGPGVAAAPAVHAERVPERRRAPAARQRAARVPALRQAA